MQSAEPPIAGRSIQVLLCRPRQESAATARTLVAQGFTPLVAPVMEIVPLPFARPPGSFDAILMTSPQAMVALGRAEAHGLARSPVYAVGRRTAAAAREGGCRDVRIGGGDGAALVDLLRLTMPPPARLLYLAGHVRKPGLPVALEAGGYSVSVVETYDARPCGAWEAGVVAALQAGAVGAALHFSRRSSALALNASHAADAGEVFGALRHVCLSDDAAAPLRDAGCPYVTVADQPDEASLLKALALILA